MSKYSNNIKKNRYTKTDQQNVFRRVFFLSLFCFINSITFAKKRWKREKHEGMVKFRFPPKKKTLFLLEFSQLLFKESSSEGVKVHYPLVELWVSNQFFWRTFSDQIGHTVQLESCLIRIQEVEIKKGVCDAGSDRACSPCFLVINGVPCLVWKGEFDSIHLMHM